MGKHHLRFGGTISWKKTSDDFLTVTLSDKYITDVTIILSRDTIAKMHAAVIKKLPRPSFAKRPGQPMQQSPNESIQE